MKAQDRSNYVIAAGVILCSAVLLGALTFALTGFSLRSGGRKLAIEFHDGTVSAHTDGEAKPVKSPPPKPGQGSLF